MSHWGGLLRERADRLDVTTGRLACGACLMAAHALNNPACAVDLKQALGALSAEVDTDSAQERASKQEFRAAHDYYVIGQRSRLPNGLGC